jgi:hypothetical protein
VHIAFFVVRGGAFVQVQDLVVVQVGREAGAADHVAAAVGHVARAKGVDAMAFAKATVWGSGKVIRI